MAQLSQLLLFDPDPNGLDTLTYGFAKDGCVVTGTADPVKARDLIHSASPPLLLVNLSSAEKVGLELLRTVSNDPRTRSLACVAIGREELRGAALGVGAFAFLSVPLFVRDAIAVCRMVVAVAVPGSRPSPDAELVLPLEALGGIYFLVRALAVTARSAVVEARHGQQRAELRFMDGVLTSAVVGAVQGLPALHQMLLWEDAALHFKFKNVVRRGSQLSMKTTEVLEECDRFLRDFAHEAKDLGVARTVYSVEQERVQPSAALPSEVVPVLKLFDGHHDLAQILNESPFRIFDTLKIVQRFVADGAIQLKSPLPPDTKTDGGSAAGGPGALDFWLQKSNPVLGLELGAGRTAHNGVPAVANPGVVSVPGLVSAAGVSAGDRVPSPFVALDGSGAAPARRRSNAIANLRSRSITKKTVAEAPVPENVVTPPPPPPIAAATIEPSKPAPAVARGEIRVSTAIHRRPEAERAEVQSVVVELGDLPAPVPLTSSAPPPVSAQAPASSIIVASQALAAAQGQPRSAEGPVPSVIVAPMTPAPVVVSPQAVSPQAASPADSPQPRRHHARSPSDSFNAVESDFFEREADLYKRESVESFEDLDGHANGTRKS